VGIVSGALEPEIEFALRKMGVREHVRFIVSAEKTAESKPDPAPFLLGVEHLRRGGHDGPAVVIEDSTGGVTAAKRAGLRCVGVAQSCAPGDLQRAGADAVVADLAALTDAILEDGL
jgi:sugar-phosphatase